MADSVNRTEDDMSASFVPLLWAMSLGKESGLTSTTKSVLIAMANHCGTAKGGACFPSYETLAKETLFSVRTVQTSVHELAELGFITVISRGDGRGKISRYILHVDVEIVAKRGETPDPEAMLIEQVEFVRGKVEPIARRQMTVEKVETGAVEKQLSDQKVEPVADKPPLNHPEPPTIHPSRAKKAAKDGSLLGEDWALSEADRQFAVKKGIDADAEAEKFRAHHEAKGTLSKSWPASWRTWCMSSFPKVRIGEGGSAGLGDPDDPYGAKAWAAKIPDAELSAIDGVKVPCVGGYLAEKSAVDICSAIGFPATWRGDLDVLAEWLRIGEWFSGMPFFDACEVIKATINGARGRPNKPTLRYFDGMVREAIQAAKAGGGGGLFP